MSGKADADFILEVENLEATYHGAVVALQGATLRVPRGNIVALLGANGAGKTTLLRAVSNLLPAQRGAVRQGRILFEGKNILSRSPAALTRLGLVQVLEGRHCFPSLTIEENLITGAMGRSLPRREVSAGLAKVYHLFPRLLEKRKTPAGLTSGGEQQMAAIGRALMARPRLLILDEPSMGLAPLTVEAIFLALKQLNQSEGLSILVAEQNATVALNFADSALFLETGVSVLDGPSSLLRTRTDLPSFYLGRRLPGPLGPAGTPVPHPSGF